MRQLKLIIAALFLISPFAANADLIFDWEFTPDSGGTVAGTISGLVEGSNDGTGVTITVDSTPTGELEGLVWDFVRHRCDLRGCFYSSSGRNNIC